MLLLQAITDKIWTEFRVSKNIMTTILTKKKKKHDNETIPQKANYEKYIYFNKICLGVNGLIRFGHLCLAWTNALLQTGWAPATQITTINYQYLDTKFVKKTFRGKYLLAMENASSKGGRCICFLEHLRKVFHCPSTTTCNHWNAHSIWDLLC